jgi:hypothetical protein
MVAGAGRTKMTNVVREALLSWQQDIVQLMIPLPAWRSQSIGESAGIFWCEEG